MAAPAPHPVLALAARRGVLRSRDLADVGLPRDWLYRLHEQGLLERVGRGLYRLPDVDVTASQALGQVAKRIPRGIVCLLSALQFHELTTHRHHDVWIAIDVKAWKPRVADLPVRVVRFSGKALATGVEHRKIEGIDVKLYSPAKTVADCFKYRHKIGLDVAIEALRAFLHRRDASIDDLWRYAKICRVTNIMRPYLDAKSLVRLPKRERDRAMEQAASLVAEEYEVGGRLSGLEPPSEEGLPAANSHFPGRVALQSPPMAARRPTFRRDNPKARQIQQPPSGVDLAEVAERCRYVGSPYHKDIPSFAGTTRAPRPDASICPRNMANAQEQVQAWLRDAVRAGRCGGWEGGFPRYIWHREADTLYEARQGSPGSGEYHGYPLEPWQQVRGLE